MPSRFASTTARTSPVITDSSVLSYSNTLEVPPPSATDAGFEERMKKIVLQQQQQQQQQKRPSAAVSAPSRPRSRSPVTEVLTLEDYKKVVAEERERVTVVRFYAPWCRACHRTAPLFDRLVATLSHHYPNNKVQFVTVPMCETTRQLMAGLGVTKMPFAHIYHPTAGLAEELSMNKKVFADFRAIVESYLDQQCELPELNEETGLYEAPYQRQS